MTVSATERGPPEIPPNFHYHSFIQRRGPPGIPPNFHYHTEKGAPWDTPSPYSPQMRKDPGIYSAKVFPMITYKLFSILVLYEQRTPLPDEVSLHHAFSAYSYIYTMQSKPDQHVHVCVYVPILAPNPMQFSITTYHGLLSSEFSTILNGSRSMLSPMY